MNDKETDITLLNRKNVYEFVLPTSKTKDHPIVILFKLLTTSDDKKIENELKYRSDLFKKQGKKESDEVKKDLSTRIKNMIISIDGNTDREYINKFKMLSLDSLEFRKYIKQITPDIELTWEFTCNHCERLNTSAIPMTVDFFWPTS